jgi:hypothetical protein
MVDPLAGLGFEQCRPEIEYRDAGPRAQVLDQLIDP